MRPQERTDTWDMQAFVGGSFGGGNGGGGQHEEVHFEFSAPLVDHDNGQLLHGTAD